MESIEPAFAEDPLRRAAFLVGGAECPFSESLSCFDPCCDKDCGAEISAAGES